MSSPEEWQAELLSPERCVLVVIDKQRWYLDPAVSPFLANGDPDIARREVDEHDRFIEAARSARVPVAWTVMTEGDDHAPSNVLARWTRRPDEPRLRREDPGFAFVGLGPAEGEFLVEKTYPDAFSEPSLFEHITALGRSTIILIGGYAGRCVLATAFGAQNRGLDVVVPRGLAEPHPRQRHEQQVFLAIIDSIVGYGLDPAEVLRAWSAAGTHPPSS